MNTMEQKAIETRLEGSKTGRVVPDAYFYVRDVEKLLEEVKRLRDDLYKSLWRAA